MKNFRVLTLPLFISVTLLQLALWIMTYLDGDLFYLVIIIIHLAVYLFSMLPFWLGTHFFKRTKQHSTAWGWLLICIFTLINLFSMKLQLDGIQGFAKWSFG